MSYIKSALCAFLAIFLVNSSYAEDAVKPPIKLGATLSMSGGLAYMGQREFNGMQLALEEINAQGGVNGRKLDLLLEDNAGDPKSAVNGATKLLQVDKVDVVLSAFTHITQAVKDIVAKSGKVMFYESGYAPIAASNVKFFRDYFNSRKSGEVVAKGVKMRAYKKVAIFSENHDGCNEYVEAVKVELGNERGVEFTRDDRFNHGETDFRPSFLRIKSTKPDVIVLCTFRDTPLAMKQLKELGMISIPTMHFVGPNAPEADTAEMRALFEENNAASSWYGFIGGPELSPQQRAFVENYSKRFGREPVADSAYTYDDIYILKAALEKCPSVTPLDQECLAARLAETDYQGVAGRARFNENRSIERDMFLVCVKKGSWESC